MRIWAWERLAEFVLPVIFETLAQLHVALYVVAVLTAGAPGVSKVVATLRAAPKVLQATLVDVAPKNRVLLPLRLLRLARFSGHFSSS